MSRTLAIVIVICLLAGAGIWYNNQQQAQTSWESNIQQATQEASSQVEQAQNQAQEVQQQAQSQAEDLASKIRDLIAKARAYLENGEYQEAINSAQAALGFDSNSSEAQSIIEKAKNMIAQAAQEKAQEATAAAQDKVGDALGSFGQ